MEKIDLVYMAVSALILLYIFWCFIEPFFLIRDKAVLKKSPKDNSPVENLKIKRTLNGAPYLLKGSASQYEGHKPRHL